MRLQSPRRIFTKCGFETYSHRACDLKLLGFELEKKIGMLAAPALAYSTNTAESTKRIPSEFVTCYFDPRKNARVVG